MREFNTVIFGASAFAIGYISMKSENVLIINKSMIIGGEFSNAIKNNPCRVRELHENTKKLKDRMIEKGILSIDGLIHIAPVSCFLCEYLKASKAEVLLNTEVVFVKKKNNEFIIRLFNYDGYSEIVAKNIIDTTSLGINGCYSDRVNYEKSVSAMLWREGEQKEINYSDKIFTVSRGKFTNEYILNMKVDHDADLEESRMKLIDCWEDFKFKFAFDGFRLASVSTDFRYDFEKSIRMEINKFRIWCPSASYNNIIAAFEGGVACDFAR